ncbi:DUF3891 family protein [Chroococcidiopsis sp. CCMEE 29]|uniref:DUF3891 family protein n=1 Tax=Chroococcidiopsis sp. CCMEE 29 TaxID=155894 RepID=UPI002020FBE0|nr:DUF3891 family protein [Chroococcidiopsis sp. CCMEE 29]
MLHRQDPAGIIVLTQPTHAWVSGCLARAWGNEHFGFFAPTEQVCLGAEQHDIGWLTWENLPTLNSKTGYPHNFMEMPTEVHVGLWSAAKQLTLPLGRYVTLLVSLHGTGLYERFRSWENSPQSSQVVQAFLQQEYAFQKQLTASLLDDPYYASYAIPEVIKRNRCLVAIWDSLSLAICTGVRNQQQLNQVPTAFGETTLTLTPLDDDATQIKVDPWPFQQGEVKLVYEGRMLREKFTDETAMRAALVNANWRTITTILSPN